MHPGVLAAMGLKSDVKVLSCLVDEDPFFTLVSTGGPTHKKLCCV